MGGLMHWMGWLEPLMSAAGLLLIVYRKQMHPYKFVAAFLCARLGSLVLLEPLLYFHKQLHLTLRLTYELYFYGYWTSDAVEALLAFGIIISIYKLAMAPLKGLEKLGMIMFRWAGAISIAIAITIGFGPHVTSMSFVTRSVMQLQQTQSVLTLCMLMFVCFAIHPMGLSCRSRVFGVSLGLGIMATADLVTAAWISHSPNMSSASSIIDGVAACITLCTWVAYFALPEPERRMIMLPTTSPFFQWNRISEILGDAPGYVAVGHVTLDMFAPAELEVMRRASTKMDTALSA